MEKKKIAVGIDIGGSNVCYGLVDYEGNILRTGDLKVKEYVSLSYTDFILDLCRAITSIIDKGNHELIGIGIGAPNANPYTGCMENPANIQFFESIAEKNLSIPLRKIVADFFNVPVQVTNDANAAAIGEMIFGKAKGINDFIMITIGTGVGGGIVANGELVYGLDGFAGEIGHVIVDINGRLCNCGRKGCLEKYVSTSGIAESYNELIQRKTGNNPCYDSSKEIAEKAYNGDIDALMSFDIAAKYLGFALANAVALTAPEAIFFFGGVVNADRLIIPATKKYMEQFLLRNFRNKINFEISALQNKNAAVLGAAALAFKVLKN